MMDKPTKNPPVTFFVFFFSQSRHVVTCWFHHFFSLFLTDIFFDFNQIFFDLISCDVKTLPILYIVVGFSFIHFLLFKKKTRNWHDSKMYLYFILKKNPKNVQTFQAAALNELLQRPVGRAEISVQKRELEIFRTRKLNSILFCT